MAITIKKVSTKRELKKFIRFNYRMYKGNPYSVPDLYDDMLNTFNKKKNAAFEFCEADYFLAYQDDKIVGRVAAIINNRANEKWGCKNVRFGWIDFIDDPEVSSALIKTVEDWGKERGMTHIAGPLGFTDFDAEGMLIEGFDQLSTMATIYNYPYYPVHMEKLGFEKDADWVEYKIYIRTDERSVQPALRLLSVDAATNQPVRKDVSPDSRLTDGYPHYRRRRQAGMRRHLHAVSCRGPAKVTRPSAPSRMVLSAESTVHETACQNVGFIACCREAGVPEQRC